MPDEDKRDDAETAAKKPTYHYYLDVRNDGKGVGPHTPASINRWLEHRMISSEILARRTDQDKWTRLSEITRFSNFLDKIAKLPPPPPYNKDPWEDEPATGKQLKKLGFFDLPFPQMNLTKGEASRLIDFFVHIDPEREKQYQEQPADEEKRDKLIQLIKRLPSITEREDYPVTQDLTNAEATELIDDLNDRLTDLDEQKDEEERQLMFLDNHFNDEDIREDFWYKKLTRQQLKLLGKYLETHDPDWSSKNRYDTAGVVLKLFPEQKKAEKRQAPASHSSSRAQSSKGCLLLIVPLVGILLYVLEWK